jgi:hypothetical protein
VLSDMLADSGDELGHRLCPHQARRRPRRARPGARRLRGRRHPRQQEPERPAEARSTVSATGPCASWWRPTSPRAASTCPASAMS